jgi:alpha-L-fucosidase
MEKAQQAKQQHEVIGIKKAEERNHFVRNPHPDAQWFFESGNLGLFIHYGISTVSGEGDLSWGMIDRTPWDEAVGGNFTITPRKYWDLARKFNPTHFQPLDWMKAIAEAGFTYAVFTTRHHDGFAMWPSDYGALNTKNYMGGRDLVGEYVEACRKYGIKVGLYYSPPDWYVHRYYMSFLYGSGKMPGREHSGLDHEPIGELPPVPPALEADYIEYCNNQVRELFTRYGKIDLLWFDGSVSDLSKAITIDEIRSYQPGIVVNDRLHGIGDYCSQYECRLPDERPKEEIWEHCHIWPENCGWAHMNRSSGYRSAKWVFDSYQTVKNWGGNMLINVGPRADGTLPEVFYTRIKELKELLDAANTGADPQQHSI